MPKSGGNAEGSPAHFILPELEAQPLESTSGIAEELILEEKGRDFVARGVTCFAGSPGLKPWAASPIPSCGSPNRPLNSGPTPHDSLVALSAVAAA